MGENEKYIAQTVSFFKLLRFIGQRFMLREFLRGPKGEVYCKFKYMVKSSVFSSSISINTDNSLTIVFMALNLSYFRFQV